MLNLLAFTVVPQSVAVWPLATKYGRDINSNTSCVSFVCIQWISTEIHYSHILQVQTTRWCKPTTYNCRVLRV